MYYQLMYDDMFIYTAQTAFNAISFFQFFLTYKGKGEREVVCGQVWWPILGNLYIGNVYDTGHFIDILKYSFLYALYTVKIKNKSAEVIRNSHKNINSFRVAINVIRYP